MLYHIKKTTLIQELEDSKREKYPSTFPKKKKWGKEKKKKAVLSVLSFAGIRTLTLSLGVTQGTTQCAML